MSDWAGSGGDRALEGLSDGRRQALAVHWERRAVSEHRIGRGFAAIAPRLEAVGAPRVVVDRCRASAGEEERHAELCLALVDRYRGTAGGTLTPAPFAVPDFGTGDERLELLYLVTGTCCINETLATVYIRTCLEAADDPVTLAANRAHLRDEMDHARLGWALLGSDWVDQAMREALAQRLPRLLKANVPLWLRDDPALPPEGEPAFGHPAGETLHGAILRAVDEVLLPGFSYLGIDVAWRPSRNFDHLRRTDHGI